MRGDIEDYISRYGHVKLARREYIKQALVKVGYPAEDLAGYVDGKTLTFQLTKEFPPKGG